MDNFDKLRKQPFYEKSFTQSTKKLIDKLEECWKAYVLSKRIAYFLIVFIIPPITIYLMFKNRTDEVYFIFIPLMALLIITTIELIVAPYNEAYKKSLEAIKIRMTLNLCNCINEHNINEGTGCNCHEEFAEFMRKEYKIKLY